MADKHNTVVSLTKQTLKGMFIGAIIGGSIRYNLFPVSSIVLKKSFNYINDNTFGTSKYKYNKIFKNKKAVK